MIELTNGVQIPEEQLVQKATASVDDLTSTGKMSVMQYDDSLPVGAVTLTSASVIWKPPEGATLRARMGKPDNKGVLNDALGMDADGTVYFAFTRQMTAAYGVGEVSIEIETADGVKSSAIVPVNIKKNPVQDDTIQSGDEYLALSEIVAAVQGSVDTANAAAEQAKQYADQAGEVPNELSDLSTGWDGTKYSSAGEAVRKQMASAFENIDLFLEKNHFDLEFGYVNEFGDYAQTQTKANFFIDKMIYLPKGSYVSVDDAPFETNPYALNLYRYSADQRYIDKVIKQTDSVGQRARIDIVEPCYARISVNKRYGVLGTDEEIPSVKQVLTVALPSWEYLSPVNITTAAAYNDAYKTVFANAYAEEKKDNFSFLMQTDTHFSQYGVNSSLNNFYNLLNLSQLEGLSFVTHLGDATHGYINPVQCQLDYCRVVEIEKRCKPDFFPVLGNHENGSLWTFSTTGNRKYEEILPKEWFYYHGILPLTGKSNAPSNPKSAYFFKDYPEKKIRVIALDTNDLAEEVVNAEGKLIYASGYQSGVRQSQITWLSYALLVPDEYEVIILSHHPLITQDGSTCYAFSILRGILEAFVAGSSYSGSNKGSVGKEMEVEVAVDFSSQGPHKIIGCFAGHTHADLIETVNGITYVQTDSSISTTSKNAEQRKGSSRYSDVIDAVVVDQASKKVSMIRFGYGSNRSYNY